MALRLVSFFGMLVLIACAWALSMNRKAFPWRVVLWGLALQFFFALVILKTSFGAGVFEIAQKVFTKLNSFAFQGAEMVFGPLANSALLAEKWGPNNRFILAITISARSLSFPMATKLRWIGRSGGFLE